jgi:hypothetical protein
MSVFLPPDGGTGREVSIAVNELAQGRLRTVGSITLVASSATTTLAEQNIAAQSALVLVPLTANAAAEIGNGTLYTTDNSTGSIVINHANNGQTDRTFRYVIFGGEDPR